MKLLFLPLALIFASLAFGAIGYMVAKVLDWTTRQDKPIYMAAWLAYLPIFISQVVLTLFGVAYLIYRALR